jgi:hypothetical protein
MNNDRNKTPAHFSSTNLYDQQSEPSEEPLVYNIMPQSKKQDEVVAATIKIEEQPEAQPAEQTPNFFKKYRLYLILAPVLIAVGFGVYFYVSHSVKNAYQPQDLLVTNVQPQPQPEIPSLAFKTPQDWRDKYFPNCLDETLCGDSADPDKDGLTNLEEYTNNTDPNNADSDLDGLADGDEVNVFGTNPLKSNSNDDPKYSDADYIKGGYDSQTGKLMTDQRKAELAAKMKKSELHEPTIITLGSALMTIYQFTPLNPSGQLPNASDTPPTINNATGTPTSTIDSSLPSGVDQSVTAKQDRDAQRTNTIKNIAINLVKYFTDLKQFPRTNDFKEMTDAIKPYNKVATNITDPINTDPFIYTYSLLSDGSDFTLTFYSETQAQQIKIHKADGEKYLAQEQAALYDDRRKTDLESLRNALILYSNNNVAGNQDYVFPTQADYKTALTPTFIPSIPKDPKTSQDYEYKVSDTFNTFTLKAMLDNPPPGMTGYLCNQIECRNY